MTDEARINEGLRALGEEYRLGMISVDEYRARRRGLLASWGERDVTTSPGALRAVPLPATAQTAVQPDPRARRSGAVPVLVIVAALLAVAAGGYGAWQKQRARAPTLARVPVTAAAPDLLAIREAADAFLERNSWDEGAVESFLGRWRALSPALRAEARQTPALRTLRYALQQNLDAEAQVLPPDAGPEQRRRLDSLTRFAQELDA